MHHYNDGNAISACKQQFYPKINLVFFGRVKTHVHQKIKYYLKINSVSSNVKKKNESPLLSRP